MQIDNNFGVPQWGSSQKQIDKRAKTEKSEHILDVFSALDDPISFALLQAFGKIWNSALPCFPILSYILVEVEG